MMNCSTCYSQLQDKWKFCSTCGNKTEQIMNCSTCDSQLQYKWKFCPTCGNKIEKMMNCRACNSKLQDTWSFCAACGTEIDKSGGIDDITLQEFLDGRKKTLDVLKRVIDDLEKYGKLDVSSSLISSGANIVSVLLWLTVPGKTVAVVGDVVASGLSIANSGVSLFTAWKENGLIKEANVVCKNDNNISQMLMIFLPSIKECVSQYGNSPSVIRRKIELLRMDYNSGNFQNYREKFKPTTKAASISILGNFAVFLFRAVQIHSGKYSLIAESLRQEMENLQAQFDAISFLPTDILNIPLTKRKQA